MGIVQDTSCGIRKFTLRDAFLDWDGTAPIPAIVKPEPLWTGMCIPRGINIFRLPDPKSSNPVFDDGTMIENGEILFGIVEKKTVGATRGGLIHVVFHAKGPVATRQLFTGIQRVANSWPLHHGFSIGISDTS